MDILNPNDFNCFIDGQKIGLFSMMNKRGVSIQITNYGGRLVSINTPDKNGNLSDIILGYNSIKGYLTDEAYMGAIVGRFADIIEFGRFTINEIDYQLNKSFGEHSIHGGFRGFDKRVWNVISNDNQHLKLHLLSKDDDENFPGNLHVFATYSLTDNNELFLEFEAETDADTILNITSHPYFNLAGHDSGNILDHQLYINSTSFATIDNDLISIDNFQSVAETPFDFSIPQIIGKAIDFGNEQITIADGYDHNFCLGNKNKELKLSAIVNDLKSGRSLEVFTTEPSLHFYSGNSLICNSIEIKDNAKYSEYSGLCLEPQNFPFSYRQTGKGTSILKVGEKYNSVIIFKFGY